MFKGILKVIIIVVILVVLAWVGLTCYSNFFAKPNTGQTDMPSQDEASYSVYIKNSGGLLLTNDYEVHGSEAGSRIFILRGFWELRGQEFEFVAGEIVLDEAIFGEITLKRRE